MIINLIGVNFVGKLIRNWLFSANVKKLSIAHWNVRKRIGDFMLLTARQPCKKIKVNRCSR